MWFDVRCYFSRRKSTGRATIFGFIVFVSTIYNFILKISRAAYFFIEMELSVALNIFAIIRHLINKALFILKNTKKI